MMKMKITVVSIMVLCLAIQMWPCLSAPGFDRHIGRTKMDDLMQELLHLGEQYGGHSQQKTTYQNAGSQDLMLHTQSDGSLSIVAMCINCMQKVTLSVVSLDFIACKVVSTVYCIVFARTH